MRFRRGIVLAIVLTLASGGAHAAGLKNGYAMCRDQKSLERLLGASVKGDAKTFGGLMGGACRATRGRERVKVAARTKTVARVTVTGRRGSWWTVVEALR